MARGDDPASATTSFFIVTGDGSSLDGKYTAFGRVVDGMPAVDAIEQAPVTGEAPVQQIELSARFPRRQTARDGLPERGRRCAVPAARLVANLVYDRVRT